MLIIYSKYTVQFHNEMFKGEKWQVSVSEFFGYEDFENNYLSNVRYELDDT